MLMNGYVTKNIDGVICDVLFISKNMLWKKAIYLAIIRKV